MPLIWFRVARGTLDEVITVSGRLGVWCSYTLCRKPSFVTTELNGMCILLHVPTRKDRCTVPDMAQLYFRFACDFYYTLGLRATNTSLYPPATLPSSLAVS
jgi:hypothetical protein